MLTSHYSALLLPPRFDPPTPLPPSLVCCLRFNPHHHLPPAPRVKERSCLLKWISALVRNYDVLSVDYKAALFPPSIMFSFLHRFSPHSCVPPDRHKLMTGEIKCACYQCSL